MPVRSLERRASLPARPCMTAGLATIAIGSPSTRRTRVLFWRARRSPTPPIRPTGTCGTCCVTPCSPRVCSGGFARARSSRPAPASRCRSAGSAGVRRSNRLYRELRSSHWTVPHRAPHSPGGPRVLRPMARRRQAPSQGAVPRGAALIRCTLGTHPAPFDRALDWLFDARGDDGSSSSTEPPLRGTTPQNVEWHRFLAYDELTELMRQASAVVCHGGVGSMMTAISMGITPVAIPRLRAHGEHVDDHQLQIVRELGSSGYVIPCLRREELAAALESAAKAQPPAPGSGGELRAVAIHAAGGNPDRLLRPGLIAIQRVTWWIA